MTSTPRLTMSGISKSFPGVRALHRVSIELQAGEVHVLLGENGAGKSTLMRVLAGSCTPDEGSITLDGTQVQINSPRHAQSLGIAIIHQELLLVPELSAAENVFLGRLPTRRGLLDRRALNARAREVLAPLDASIDVQAPAGMLSLAQQQLVEIARALSINARVLIMDEPTSALTTRESERLFAIIRTLTAAGVSVIYISHRMDELFAIGDRVTVLRDGEQVTTQEMSTASRSSLIRLMANREVQSPPVPEPRLQLSATPRLQVTALSRSGRLHNISFSVAPGEILGFAGLLGAGRTELARALFGADPLDAGTVLLDGAPVAISSPRDAIRAGIAFVTEDRKREGLLLDRSMHENVVLTVAHQLGVAGVLQPRAESTLVSHSVHRLQIRAASAEVAARTLSGGNQQKVVLAKWLATKPRVLMLDEPTRGIDVAAKAEVHQLIRELAAQGTSVLLFSSELPEIMALADRTVVMRSGRIEAEFTRASSSAELLLSAAVGH